MTNFISAKSLFLLLVIAISGFTIATAPQNAFARQDNYCDCDVSSGSCSCKKDWKISPDATHTYRMTCKAYTNARENGTTLSTGSGYDVAVVEYDDSFYWFSVGLEGKASGTTCTSWDSCNWEAERDCMSRQCTNWSPIHSDSTSTTVTCHKSDERPKGVYGAQ